MQPPWTQRFDFYVYRSARDIPIAINLDMAASDFAPIATHPTLLLVSVTMKHPAPNGLRSNEEFDELNAAEDILIASATGAAEAIYVGRFMSEGIAIYQFYVPIGASDAELTDSMKLLSVPGYSWRAALQSDPEWAAYRRMYPTVFHQNAMANRALQAQPVAQGDRLSRKRMVDHLAYFPTEAAAGQALKALLEYKFAVDPLRVPDEHGSYILEFHRKDRCDGQHPDLATAQILDAIEPSGGTYDGWSCFIKR